MKKTFSPHIEGIYIKKQFGQHFLREQHIIDTMIQNVTVTTSSSIFEIGCGDGFLTRSLLNTPCARIWVFEIDPDWSDYVQKNYADPRLHIFQENILDVDFTRFTEYKPWTLLANLPYQITFPILYLLTRHHQLLTEGVVMVQEEVAQKIVQTSGRGYGYASLYLQYFFEWKLLTKIPPTAFFPPPKVNSRLLYFKPRQQLTEIPDAERFWKFIKLCFSQPRRTLKNNLQQSIYASLINTHELAALRAQQMSFTDLLALWQTVRVVHST